MKLYLDVILLEQTEQTPVKVFMSVYGGLSNLEKTEPAPFNFIRLNILL